MFWGIVFFDEGWLSSNSKGAHFGSDKIECFHCDLNGEGETIFIDKDSAPPFFFLFCIIILHFPPDVGKFKFVLWLLLLSNTSSCSVSFL